MHQQCCPLCRRPLFRQSGVVTHDPSHSGGKPQVIGQRSVDKKDFRAAGNACDVFIEPVTWMADMILTIEGKVSNFTYFWFFLFIPPHFC